MLLSVNKIELTVRCIRVPFRGSMSTVKKKKLDGALKEFAKLYKLFRFPLVAVPLQFNYLLGG